MWLWIKIYIEAKKKFALGQHFGFDLMIEIYRLILEYKMATQSIIAWNIAWSEEPGGRSPWGAKNRTQLSDWVHMHTYQLIIRKSGCRACCVCMCVCVYSYIYINIYTTFNYLKLALRTTI